MTPSLRNSSRRTTRLLGLALLTIWSTGCRGNLGNAVAVATGRAEVQSLQAAAAARAAQANPMAAAAPGGAYPRINQASFATAGSPAGPAGVVEPFPAVDPATGNPASPPTRDEAFAAVLPELQRLAETNPAARQRLLARMETADPVYWPLLVQREHANLGMHQQLNNERSSATGAARPAGSPPSGSGARPARHDQQAPTPGDRSTPPQATGSANAGDRFSLQQVAYNEPPNQGATAFAPPPMRREGPPQRTIPARFDTPSAAPRGGPTAELVSGRAPLRESSHPGPRVIDNPMAAPAPASPAERLGWRDALRHAITDLDQTAPSPPQSAGEAYEHARLRLLQLAAGDLDGASTAIPGLSSTEQSYWSHQLFALAKLMDDQTHPETKRRAAAANLHLAKAAAELDELSSLTIRSLTFCDKVYGFGAYDPIDDPTFRPGGKLTLYAEVRHYKSMRVGDGLHAATLATSYRLLNARGDVIEADNFPLIEDECYSKRRDFHIQFTYPLPENLRPGEYRLELTIEDRLGHKRGTASIDLWVE